MLSKDELEHELDFSLKGKTALVTFHPATLENNTSKRQFQEILSALNAFKDLRIIFTRPNSDINGRVLISLIDQYVKKNSARAIVFSSLGQLKYLSLMKHADVMLGNSSSGIIEMPSFRKPTINIGDRQKGRIAAGSVIQCDPEEGDVRRALAKAFSDKFRRACAKVRNPYDKGPTAKRIVAVLKRKLPLVKSLKKAFYDL